MNSHPATKKYRGTLAERDHGEAYDILFLDDDGESDEPLAETIADDIDRHGGYLSVRYWTADSPLDDDAIAERALREILGDGDARYRACYSDVTGYLWTDEDINVGGHDLLAELKSHAGRYCLIEIGYSPAPPASHGPSPAATLIP